MAPKTTKTGKANTLKQAPQPPVPAAATPTPPPALPPAPEGFINVFVDGELIHVKKGSTVMQACTQAAKEIPHFCYHERLSIAGNCRMCLVEIEGMPKPIASCHWPAAEAMKIRTDSPMTINARKGTMELLLINHPLDCPICDQGGECALQDQSVAYGGDRSHYNEFKRAVDDKDIGSKIKTVMTRCIHCTRCIRFATEVAGVEEMGATGRGENMSVGTYVEQAIQSELSGNMIDLCPVGALTSKPYAFTARPWELVRTTSIDILDAVGTPITVDNRHGQVLRTQPRENNEINEEWMTDAARFSYDALATNRLTSPMIRRGKELQPCSWAEAFTVAKTALAHPTGAILGSMASAEDAFSFKSFMETVLPGSPFDCRPSGSQLENFYTFNTPLIAFEQVDAVLLIGCNPRLEAPLLNVRLRRGALKRRMPVAAIGADMDLTYPFQQLENAPETLEQLISGKHKFADVLKGAQKPAIIVSASVLTRPDGQAIMAMAEKLAKKVGVLTEGWNGLNVLASTAGRITALDMKARGTDAKSNTASIVKAFNAGKLQTLIVYGEDTVTIDDLEKGQGTVIYLGTHNTALAQKADIVLPTAAWSEKSGLYANLEGRVQLAHAAVQPPLNAKEDWKIFRALSEDMGKALPFNNLTQLRASIAAFAAPYAGENWNKISMRGTSLTATAEKASSKPFAPVVTEYYQRLEYLRQSPTMLKCQAEVATAKLGHTGSAPAPLTKNSHKAA
ncbi:MAG: NADH-quinone oxidoreductase subunit G [Pseudomonas fluorescens]|nr:MAG: NADH-quinone oxidoreductase subunit G [Pseudomonas fluorescens]